MSKNIAKQNRRKIIIILILTAVLLLTVGVSLFAGAAGFEISENTDIFARILGKIRLPRILAAITAGAGLAVAGLIMQTALNNKMASPSTLGVSNAAVFGANLSLIVFGGSISGMLATSVTAFIFSVFSVFLILGICRIRSYSPGTVVLAGIAIGAMWTALTTIVQFYATDVGISAAVVWSFGDLSRATYETDIIMAAVVLAGIVFFMLVSWKLNALLAGDAAATGMGINVRRLRFALLLAASIITSVCVSFLGIIGFLGIVAPHVIKKILGQEHHFSIPATALLGSLILLLSDTLSRTIGGGMSLPVGAITSLIGAPFFIAIVFARKGEE